MIRIDMHSGNIATETEFDAWCDFAASHLAARVGYPVSVRRMPYRARASSDKIHAETQDLEELVREAMGDLWYAWCAR